jgi:hypothetical protein
MKVKMLRLLTVLCTIACLGGCFSMKVKAPDIDPPEPRHRDGRGGHASSRRVRFGANDLIAGIEKPVKLTAWLQMPRDHKPIEGAVIAFYLKGEMVASEMTDRSGTARAPWKPKRAGRYRFQARVLEIPDSTGLPPGDVPPLDFVVCVCAPGESIVMADLDYCVYASRAKRVWLSSTRPEPGAAAALGNIARKHLVVYKTIDAREQSPATQQWLRKNGFPPGPVMLSIKGLKNVKAAVCGKEDEARELCSRGVNTFFLEDFDSDDPEDLFDDARRLDRMNRRLNVVTRWSQAERGIIQGLRFPPSALARELRQRARRIQAEER